MTRDPFEILGLAPGASEAEVRAAWRAVSKRVHPDVGGSADEFREALVAYETLLTELARPDRAFDRVSWASEPDLQPWLVDVRDGADERWSYRPRREVLTTIAIATAVLVLVVILLTPALLALPR